MRCPFCKENNSSVKDSRESFQGAVIRRRRECLKCSGRFTTFERLQQTELVVVKRSGTKKPFDRDKILKAITIALRKRNFTAEEIEKITDNITLQIESSSSREIKSRAIGQLIMAELAKIDHVAYIRFASVYKDFSTLQDFAKFINKMQES